jgi:hypothetical protein
MHDQVADVLGQTGLTEQFEVRRRSNEAPAIIGSEQQLNRQTHTGLHQTTPSATAGPQARG